MVWVGGLEFYGYPQVTIPFIFGDPRTPNHQPNPNQQFTVALATWATPEVEVQMILEFSAVYLMNDYKCRLPLVEGLLS